jgi:hypothetical protein
MADEGREASCMHGGAKRGVKQQLFSHLGRALDDLLSYEKAQVRQVPRYLLTR